MNHPVPRMYSAFVRRILSTGPGSYPEVRAALMRIYDLPLPDDPSDPGFDLAAMRRAFIGFLSFVKGNLNGQTSVRVDPAWASQNMLMQGMAQFALPDMVIRTEKLEEGLGQLCAQVGIACPPVPEDRLDAAFTLKAVYNEDVEEAVRAACQRDYMIFGYGPWGG